MSPIRALVADDHPMISGGLTNELPAFGIEVVASVADGSQVIGKYLELKPDVLVLDLRMEQVKGLEVATELLASDRDARIVFYSQFKVDRIIREAYRIGGMGFVPKNAPLAVLAEAISSAYRREQYWPPDIAQALAKMAVRGEEAPQAKLAERELLVFKMLAEGQTHAEIAATLHLNPKTIGLIVQQIKDALHISRPAEFTRLAIRYQLIDE